MLQRLETQVNYIGYDKELLTQGMKVTLGSVGLRNTEIVQGSLNGLLSLENFQLIYNDELKKMLTAYPSTILSFKERELSAKNVVYYEHRPIQGRYVSWTDMLKEDKEKYPNREHRAIKSDYEGMLRDQEFQDVLVNEMWHINRTISGVKGLLIKSKEIAELINERLKTKGPQYAHLDVVIN